MNWRREIAILLYPDAFTVLETKNKAISALRSENTALGITNVGLIEDKLKLTGDLSKCKQSVPESPLFSLEPFKTNRTYKINNTYKQLHQHFNNKSEKAIVQAWVNDNLKLTELTGTNDVKAFQLRQMLFKFFGSKDIWEADEVQNTFDMPSTLIERGFKGNCNDWFTFMMYVYECVFGEDNKLYGVIGGLNLPRGYANGNHAYCLWQHSDEKFYVIESAVGQKSPWNGYIKQALVDFGDVDQPNNFRYGKVVWMANTKETYYQVNLG